MIASTKGPIRARAAALFPRIAEESPFDTAPRELGVAYVHGMEPLPSPGEFSISIVPGVGEYFAGPALTLSGPAGRCAWRRSRADRWTCSASTPPDDLDGWLATCKWLCSTSYFPWEAERCRGIRLTDDKGTLKGALSLSCASARGGCRRARPCSAMGDAVVLNDPLVGQGANNAAKGVTVVTRELAAHGDAPYDEEWLRHVGGLYWQRVRWSTGFTNMMLNPPPHVALVFDAGARSAAFANVLANGTNEPATLFPWLETEAGVRAYLEQPAA